MRLSDFPKYYAAATSFLSALVVFLGTVQTNEAITNVAPSNWTYGIGVAASVLAGVLTHARKVEPAVEATQNVSEVLEDLTKVIESYKQPTKAIEAATEAVKDVVPAVKSVPVVVDVVTSTVSDILDEVTKVIDTYKSKL